MHGFASARHMPSKPSSRWEAPVIGVRGRVHAVYVSYQLSGYRNIYHLLHQIPGVFARTQHGDTAGREQFVSSPNGRRFFEGLDLCATLRSQVPAGNQGVCFMEIQFRPIAYVSRRASLEGRIPKRTMSEVLRDPSKRHAGMQTEYAICLCLRCHAHLQRKRHLRSLCHHPIVFPRS